MIGVGDPGSIGLQLVLLFFRVTVVIGCAWILARTFSRASAAVRHGLWAAALFAALGLPALQLLLPPVPVSLPAALHLSTGQSDPSPLALRHTSSVARAGVGGVGDATRGGPGYEAVPAGDATDRNLLADIPWGSLVLGLWLLGVLARLAWIGVQGIRTKRILASARGPDARSRRVAADVVGGLGVRQPVRLVLTQDVSMPLTWGLVRPVIALPETVVDWPEERLRVALLHEMAHVRRRDYLTCMAAELACAVYWPLPPVWVARERLRAEQELSCDDQVLLAGMPSLNYAEHLLAVARDFYGRKTPLGVAIGMAREIRLKDRVRAILDEEVDRRPLRAGGGLPGLLIIAAVGLPLAAIQSGDASAPAPPPADASIHGSTAELVRLEPQPSPDLPVRAEVEHSVLSYWFEAESAGHSGAVAHREDLDASGAAYVSVRPGSGQGSTSSSGTIFTPVSIEREDEFIVWVRMISDGGEMLHLSVDDDVVLKWTPDSPRRRNDRDWRWMVAESVDAAGVRAPFRLRLARGDHLLALRGEGDPAQIDRVLVTSDPTFQPSGRGLTDALHPPTSVFFEAEHAQRTGRFRTGSDRDALGGKYLVFRSDRDSLPEGLATFTLEVEHAGRYLVWGRVLPRDDDENSFFVSVNGGAEMIWDVPSRDDVDDRDWRWDPLNARDVDGRTVDPFVLDLAAGSHELRLRTRESGSRLDALLVTNDLTERPRRILASLAAESDPPGGD